MICPNCQTQVSDDSVICDNCNFIIDSTFLGADITNQKAAATPPPPAEDDGRTKVKAVKPKAEPSEDDGRTKVKAIKPKAAEPTPAPVMAAAAVATIGAEDSGEENRNSLAVLAAPPASVNEALYEISDQYKAFPAVERFATAAATVFVISLGLPWRWTEADDTVIGLVADAWPLGLLALFVMSAAYVRRQKRLRPFKVQYVTGTMIASLLSLLGTAVYVSRSISKERIHIGGNLTEVWRSTPREGAIIALLASFVMLGATLKAWLDRERLPDA